MLGPQFTNAASSEAAGLTVFFQMLGLRRSRCATVTLYPAGFYVLVIACRLRDTLMP